MDNLQTKIQNEQRYQLLNQIANIQYTNCLLESEVPYYEELVQTATKESSDENKQQNDLLKLEFSSPQLQKVEDKVNGISSFKK